MLQTAIHPRATLLACLLASGCMFHFDRNLAPGDLAGTAVYRSATGVLVPAAGATLTVENSGLSVTADSKGAFVLTGLPAGTFTLDAMASPGGLVSGEVGLHLTGLTLAPGDGLDLGQIVLDSLGSIQGTVSVDGSPVGMGAVATIAGLAQANVADGLFQFLTLLPGAYQVSVFDPENPGALVSAPITVQVSPAAIAHPAIALTTQSNLVTSGAVQGLVQLAGAQSNGNVDVQFSGSGPDLTTSPSGVYSSGGVPAAIYTVTASLGGFGTVSVPYVLVGAGTTVIPTITLLPVTSATDGGPLNSCVVDSECPADQICVAGMCTTMAGSSGDAGADAGPVDAGAEDAGPVDAGAPDAGSRDAGEDAGPPDAGAQDAGPLDAGPADSGIATAPDAGSADAGSLDAGIEDAGPEDAGIEDAGPEDAGPIDAGPPVVAPEELFYPNNPAVYLVEEQIPDNVPELMAGTDVVYSVSPPLPSGLSIDPTAGTIFGTPTAPASTATYTVTAMNSAGSTTATLTITVNVAYVSGVTGTLGTGADYGCALVNGGVQCWGTNNAGQLGNNDSTVFQSLVPVQVYGLTSGVQAIASGGDHTCALVNGGVQCWGSNSNGQLGSGTTAGYSYIPIPVTGLTSGVQVVAAGTSFNCAIANGDLQCWGYGLNGNLGTGSIGIESAPTPVQPIGMTSGVQAVSLGAYHSCAIVNGGAWCWGYGSNGQLGVNSTSEIATPTQVLGLSSGVQAIAAGTDHTCAIVNGGLQCWGSNGLGNLGNNSTTQSNVPIQVPGLTAGVQAVAVSNATCAIANGGLQCWGENNYGQLGINSAAAGSEVPTQVAGLASGVQSVSLGITQTCAIAAGGVQCWGDDTAGALGNNSTTQTYAPVSVVGLSAGVQGLGGSTEAQNFCAIVNGTAQCWGDNMDGTLGNNSTVAYSDVPVATSLTSGVEAISPGTYHVCAIVNGGAQCWGDNTSGDLGNNSTTPSPLPVAVTGLTSGVQAIASGRYFACALVNGGVQCWGDSTNGQLGNNATTPSPVPVTPVGLTGGVATVAAGLFHACALVSGTVECWGANNDGQLGNDTQIESTVPVQVLDSQGSGPLTNVQAIATGYEHTCAIVNGAAQCWGLNFNGQLGNNSGNFSPVPVQAVGLTGGVEAIAAGESHSCAIVNGGLQCWGDNGAGQVGVNTTFYPDAFVPMQVIGLTSGVQAVTPGATSTCALVNGGVQCWGGNIYGQLGNNTEGDGNYLPVPLSPFAGP